MKRALTTIGSHMDMTNTIAIVLGGGRGSRLYPLTAERAKPAVPLAGQYRLIDIPLSNCIYSDVRQIFVLTQFNSVSLNRHVIDSYKFDNFSPGFVEILAAEQTTQSCDWYQGTADAVRKHLKHVMNCGASHYLIVAGDHLYRMDYRDLMETHLRTDADITVSSLPVVERDTSGFGIIKVHKNGRIKEFVEKPDSKEMLKELVSPPDILAQYGMPADTKRKYLASMGVYLFRAEILEEVLEARPDWIDFGKDILPGLLRDRNIVAHLFPGYWEDIGTVRSYYEASLALVGPDPAFEFHEPDHLIYTHPRYLPGSRVQNAEVNDAIICGGCRIAKASITQSIIGIRSVIHPGAHIERSIIMGADYYEDGVARGQMPIGIGEGAHISNAIIDKNARIGKNVTIIGSKRLKDRTGDGYAIRDGIVIVLKNAAIPDGTHIGG